MDDANNAGAAETCYHFVTAESLELFGDRAGRPLNIEQQLRDERAGRASRR